MFGGEWIGGGDSSGLERSKSAHQPRLVYFAFDLRAVLHRDAGLAELHELLGLHLRWKATALGERVEFERGDKYGEVGRTTYSENNRLITTC